MGKTEDIKEMAEHIRGLEGLKAEYDKYLREARHFDEYYFKVLRDRNNMAWKIKSIKNRIDLLRNPKERGIEPQALPYGTF
jgi:hypothetical protein